MITDTLFVPDRSINIPWPFTECGKSLDALMGEKDQPLIRKEYGETGSRFSLHRFYYSQDAFFGFRYSVFAELPAQNNYGSFSPRHVTWVNFDNSALTHLPTIPSSAFTEVLCDPSRVIERIAIYSFDPAESLEKAQGRYATLMEQGLGMYLFLLSSNQPCAKFSRNPKEEDFEFKFVDRIMRTSDRAVALVGHLIEETYSNPRVIATLSSVIDKQKNPS
jgi:hypothetical protein